MEGPRSVQQRIFLRITMLLALLTVAIAGLGGYFVYRIAADRDRDLDSLVKTVSNAIGHAHATNNQEVIQYLRRVLERNQGLDIVLVSVTGTDMLTGAPITAESLRQYTKREPVFYYPGNGPPREIGAVHFQNRSPLEPYVPLIVLVLASLSISGALALQLRRFLDQEVIRPLQAIVQSIKEYSAAGFTRLSLNVDGNLNREFAELCQEVTAMDISLQEAQAALRQRIEQEQRFRAFKSVLHDIKNYILKISLPARNIRRQALASNGLPEADQAFLLKQCTILDHTAEQMENNFQSVKAAIGDDGDSVAPINVVMRDEPFDVQRLVARAVQDFQMLGETMQISVSLEQSGHTEAPIMVRGDSRVLSNAVDNLLKNAFDVLSDGAVSAPQVTVYLVCLAENVLLQVADNGPGMPDDAVRDFVLERHGRSRSGWGVGLKYVRENIRLMGGSTTYEPNQPAGSRFSISLEAVTHA